MEFSQGNTISRFEGPYEFLSNFYPSKIIDCVGNEWPTVEHYFQAMKADNEKDRDKIRNAPDPATAKKLGRSVQLRAD